MFSVREYLKKFENKIKSSTNANYVALTSSGTSALHLSLLASNVEQNNEVITQLFSFVATVNSILYTGANLFLLILMKMI